MSLGIENRSQRVGEFPSRLLATTQCGVRFGRPNVAVPVSEIEKLREKGFSWREIQAQTTGIAKDTQEQAPHLRIYAAAQTPRRLATKKQVNGFISDNLFYLHQEQHARQMLTKRRFGMPEILGFAPFVVHLRQRFHCYRYNQKRPA